MANFSTAILRPGILFFDRHRPRPSVRDQTHAENCERDAEQLLEPRGIMPETLPPHALFHSRWFARWDGTPVPVEFMAGFSMMEDGEWMPVLPASREEKGGLFVPSREELKALLHRFGRGKDLQRAAAL